MNGLASTLAGAAIALLGIGTLLWRAADAPPAGSERAGSPAPRLLDAQRASAAPSFLGVVIPEDAVDVAARTDGWVETLHARLGDRIEAGAALTTLNDDQLRDEVAMAQAVLQAARAEEEKAALELEEARERLERWERATREQAQVLSQEELTRARYQEKLAAQQWKAAQARAAEQRARAVTLERKLRDTAVRAPFTGRVAVEYVAQGAVVTSGTPIVRLVATDHLRVRFAVPADRSAVVAPGVRVQARVLELDVTLSGAVEKVAPEVDPASRMIFAEARMEPPAHAQEMPLSGRVVRVSVSADGAAPGMISPAGAPGVAPDGAETALRPLP